jgi:gliding motility-associated lipoprotein GldD
MLYELSGNTATNFQFYVTDSNHHYLRGALYFNEATNLDSIQPSLAFLKTDILHMLQTLRWQQ